MLTALSNVHDTARAITAQPSFVHASFKKSGEMASSKHGCILDWQVGERIEAFCMERSVVFVSGHQDRSSSMSKRFDSCRLLLKMVHAAHAGRSVLPQVMRQSEPGSFWSSAAIESLHFLSTQLDSFEEPRSQ